MNPSQPKTPANDNEGEEEVRPGKEEYTGKEANCSDTVSRSILELRLGSSSRSRSKILEGLAFSATAGTDQAARSSVIHSMLMSSRLLNGVQNHKTGTNRLEPSWPFADPPFIDPWSLAARQQKAALELAHNKSASSSSTSPSDQTLPRETHPPPPLVVVGWPPVCSFRRNMVTSKAGRPEVEDERKAKRARFGDEEPFNGYDHDPKGAMFVKVNMEGYSVGRKIDLSSHVSYDSLSDSVRKLFLNFLSLDGSEEYKGGAPNHGFLLLYEDNEGDRMLVGDVPWEMFLTSVKRLYIVRSPKPQAHEKVGRSPHADMDAKEYVN